MSAWASSGRGSSGSAGRGGSGGGAKAGRGRGDQGHHGRRQQLVIWAEDQASFRVEQEHEGLNDQNVSWFLQQLQAELKWSKKVFCSSLNLSRNELGDAGVQEIMQFLVEERIPVQMIKLYKNWIADDGLRAIGELIKHSPEPVVQEIHLSHNCITQVGALAVFEAVRESGRYPCSRGREGSPLWLRMENNQIVWEPILDKLVEWDFTWTCGDTRDAWRREQGTCPLVSMHRSYHHQTTPVATASGRKAGAGSGGAVASSEQADGYKNHDSSWRARGDDEGGRANGRRGRDQETEIWDDDHNSDGTKSSRDGGYDHRERDADDRQGHDDSNSRGEGQGGRGKGKGGSGGRGGGGGGSGDAGGQSGGRGQHWARDWETSGYGDDDRPRRGDDYRGETRADAGGGGAAAGTSIEEGDLQEVKRFVDDNLKKAEQVQMKKFDLIFSILEELQEKQAKLETTVQELVQQNQQVQVQQHSMNSSMQQQGQANAMQQQGYAVQMVGNLPVDGNGQQNWQVPVQGRSVDGSGVQQSWAGDQHQFGSGVW